MSIKTGSRGYRGHFDRMVSTCALVVSVVATVLAVYTAYSESQQKKIENLVALYAYLHDPALSRARGAVRDPAFDASYFSDDVHRVCSSFDLAGNLVRNGAVDEFIFLDYWHATLLVLDKRLGPMWDREMADGQTVRMLYKDFYWLVQEAKKRR
ncbi:MAG: hypothetical protein AAB229_04080 [Candidatus Hydrogenedentota bacterium]